MKNNFNLDSINITSLKTVFSNSDVEIPCFITAILHSSFRDSMVCSKYIHETICLILTLNLLISLLVGVRSLWCSYLSCSLLISLWAATFCLKRGPMSSKQMPHLFFTSLLIPHLISELPGPSLISHIDNKVLQTVNYGCIMVDTFSMLRSTYGTSNI